MHSSNLTGRTAKIGPDHPNARRFTPTRADRIPHDPAARDPQWPDRWPLRTHLELAPLDTATACPSGGATTTQASGPSGKSCGPPFIPRLLYLAQQRPASSPRLPRAGNGRDGPPSEQAACQDHEAETDALLVADRGTR